MRIRSIALIVAGFFLLPLTARSADAVANKRNDAGSEKLGLKLSLQCWTFNRLSFFETVDKAAGLGIKYLEMYPGQKLEPDSKTRIGSHLSDADIARIKKKLADAGGLKVVAFGVAGVPTDEKAARKLFEWARKMGIEVLVTETTPTDLHDKLCQEFKIRYALHNHPTTWPPDQVLKASKDRSNWIGACCDTGHWMRANYTPVETLKKVKGRVEHLHFKDLNMFGKGHDVPWGTGRGDVKGMLTELKNQGYKGYLSVEYEYGDLAHLADNLPKCVAYFDKITTELAK